MNKETAQTVVENFRKDLEKHALPEVFNGSRYEKYELIKALKALLGGEEC